MADVRFLVRPLIAAPFIVGGINVLRAPRAPAEKTMDIALPIAEKVGLPKDPVKLVKLNAAAQIGGGVLLALGVFPRVTSLLLSGSLLPTTIAGHRFWEEKDAAKRMPQLIQFAKNASILGGLFTTALDTGGRPSVFWSGKRAVSNAAGSIGSAAQSLADSVAGGASTAYHALPLT